MPYIFNILIIVDKIGELWATDLPSMKKRLCLGGHSASVVTDLVVSPCNRYVASCDRDEKIKIWSLPSFAIHSYCLAHTSVVTSLCFVTLQNVRSSSSSSSFSSAAIKEKHYLCSVSWDGSLCLWDHISGALIDRILLVTPVPSAPATVINDDSSALPAEELQKDDDCKGEEAENDNEEPDRVYDESKAGNFPFKIVAMHGRSEKEKADVDEGICYVAIAVRGERALRFVPITTISSSASAGEEGIIHTSTNTTENKREGVRFGAITSFSLPEIPFDLAVLPSSSSSSAFGDKLLVLLPAPFYLLALQVHAEGRAMPVATSGPLASAVHSFAAYCVKEGKPILF